MQRRLISKTLLLLIAAGFVLVLALGCGTTPTQTARWTLLWNDEFTGPAGAGVNTANWLYDTGTGYGCAGCPAHWGTGEVETMSNSTANVALDGAGHLAITPIRDGKGNWTSGRIETRRTDFAAPVGGELAVEISLQQPNVTGATAAGYWPAAWMLGSAFRGHYLKWPSIGEIDVMEDVNGLSSEFATLHCGTYPGGKCNEPGGISSGQRACSGCQTTFHTYRMEYDRSVSPEQIRWYLDGVNVFTVSASQVDATTWANATQHGFFVILDVAMGGGFPAAFGGGPTAATASGVPLLVDYVRVYTAAGRAHSTFQVNPASVSLMSEPGASPSPQCLMLANPGNGTLNWSTTSLSNWVSVAPVTGSLAPRVAQHLTLTFNTPSALPRTYTTLSVIDPNASNLPFPVQITVVAANISKQRYFAEGYKDGCFVVFLTLANSKQRL